MIRVERGWDYDEGEQDGKSRAARRTVPLIGRLAPVLAAHELATGGDGKQLVFRATAAEPFTPSSVRRRALAAWGWGEIAYPKPREGTPKTVWVAAREEALEPIGLHEARHTFDSLMIAADRARPDRPGREVAANGAFLALQRGIGPSAGPVSSPVAVLGEPRSAAGFVPRVDPEEVPPIKEHGLAFRMSTLRRAFAQSPSAVVHGGCGGDETSA